jgi:hypothetical protein
MHLFYRVGLVMKLDEILRRNPLISVPQLYRDEIADMHQAEADAVVAALVSDDTPSLPDPPP